MKHCCSCLIYYLTIIMCKCLALHADHGWLKKMVRSNKMVHEDLHVAQIHENTDRTYSTCTAVSTQCAMISDEKFLKTL